MTVLYNTFFGTCYSNMGGGPGGGGGGGGVTSVYVRLSHRIQKGLDRTGQDRT